MFQDFFVHHVSFRKGESSSVRYVVCGSSLFSLLGHCHGTRFVFCPLLLNAVHRDAVSVSTVSRDKVSHLCVTAE